MRRRIALVAGMVASVAAVAAPAAQAGTSPQVSQARAAGQTVSAAASWKCQGSQFNPNICIKRTRNVLQLKLIYMGKYTGGLYAEFFIKRKDGDYQSKGEKTLNKRLTVKSPYGKYRTIPSGTFTCPKNATYVKGTYAWNSKGMVTDTPTLKCR